MYNHLNNAFDAKLEIKKNLKKWYSNGTVNGTVESQRKLRFFYA